MSFSPSFFFLFNLFRFQKGLHQHVCACVHVVCSYAVFQPSGHASGTSTYYICHRSYHVTSIFSRQVSLLCLEGHTLPSLSLLFPSVSVTPSLLPSLYICQPPTLSFVSRLRTFHHLSFTSLKSQRQQKQSRCSKFKTEFQLWLLEKN